MGISKPIVSEIAYHTFAINEFGMATCFILWGTERGLMIDCGCGMYNVKEIADELCPVPYDVVITHAHGDHIGSCDRFEEIYMHEDDVPDMEPDVFFAGKEMLTVNYPKMMAGFGSFEAYDITPSQARYPEKLPKVIGIKEGHVFHLGGRDLDVVHTPGHTKGEIVLFDPTARILFSGDACNPGLGLGATSINTALKGILKIKARENEFDRNFNGHIGYGSSTVNQSMPESCVDDCLFILRGILDGSIKAEAKETPHGKRSMVVHGHTRISWDPDRIIDLGEEPAE